MIVMMIAQLWIIFKNTELYNLKEWILWMHTVAQ